MEEKRFLSVEDLEVYQMLCRLHLEICNLSHGWPAEERYELGSQIRRSSNSSPAQLAEKNDDRHIRNKIEGVNRSRGEAAETIHHLYVAYLKNYLTQNTFDSYRERYRQCIRMLNGLEKTLEQKIPAGERCWQVSETAAGYDSVSGQNPSGWPSSFTPDTRHPTP